MMLLGENISGSPANACDSSSFASSQNLPRDDLLSSASPGWFPLGAREVLEQLGPWKRDGIGHFDFPWLEPDAFSEDRMHTHFRSTAGLMTFYASQITPHHPAERLVQANTSRNHYLISWPFVHLLPIRTKSIDRARVIPALDALHQKWLETGDVIAAWIACVEATHGVNKASAITLLRSKSWSYYLLRRSDLLSSHHRETDALRTHVIEP